MKNRISVVGEVYNDWTIVQEIGMTKNRHLKVIAKCKCGTEGEKFYSKIKNGQSKCCGKCGIKNYKEGDRVGMWTVMYKVPTKGNERRWHCKCDCGKEKDVLAIKLDYGRTFSCGCRIGELTKQREKTHGMKNTKVYRAWMHMKQRCNKNAECHKRYYDRGIKVCEEWRNSFEKFYEYVSKLPNFEKDNYSLDRINNDGNYEPGNVRWADMKTQSLNKENTIFLEYNGERKTLIEIS